MCDFYAKEHIVGQRVIRSANTRHDNSGVGFGFVIKVYPREKSVSYTPGIDDEESRYDVLWDNGKTEKGFLHHGLEPVSTETEGMSDGE